MSFLTWKYRRRIELKREIELDECKSLIKERLKELKVDVVNDTEKGVHFKNSFFNGQGKHHLMASVDEGWIEIDFNRQELIYKISITRMFLILCGMCAFFFLVTWNVSKFIPSMLLFWLLGMNLISARIRHYYFANKLKKMVVNSSIIHDE